MQPTPRRLAWRTLSAMRSAGNRPTHGLHGAITEDNPALRSTSSKGGQWLWNRHEHDELADPRLRQCPGYLILAKGMFQGLGVPNITCKIHTYDGAGGASDKDGWIAR